ncbi:MAG: GspH/FimT family pseudopilin [Halioglobus sp.]
MQRNDGFTLIELLISVMVLAVLMAIAAPSLQNLIKDNRILSEVYAFRANLNTARSEAMTQRTFVSFCNSDDGQTCGGDWNRGYIAFTDFDGDGILDPGTVNGDELILSRVLDSTSIDMNLINPDSETRIRFNGQGYARNFGGTLELCDDRGATKARAVIISRVGAVSAALNDPNDPDSGILFDREGNNLDCN